MIKINIKPLSVNSAWRGQRFKTDAYKNYDFALNLLLPKNYELPAPPFEIHLEFGFSSANSDWDNCIKQFQDVLATKYNFNDRYIKKGIVVIEDVKKGQEYIKFELVHYKKT
jgi:Holliday junction resolvase RusA-like endonuclease